MSCLWSVRVLDWSQQVEEFIILLSHFYLMYNAWYSCDSATTVEDTKRTSVHSMQWFINLIFSWLN